MRITHCLLSCDSNPKYLGFWPVVAKAWLKLGIRPVLFYVKTNPAASPPDIEGGTVHTLEPIPDIPFVIQACTLRFWGSRLYPDNIVITSDLDLIPLSKKFFTDDFINIEDDYYVHKRSWPRRNKAKGGGDYGIMRLESVFREHPVDQAEYLNVSYNIARGDTMSRVLQLSDSWEDDCRKITPYWYKVTGAGAPRSPEETIHDMKNHHNPGNGEEVYSSVMVAIARQNGEKIKLLTYSAEESDWICRSSSHDGVQPYDEQKLRAGFYSALHCPRPYSKNREIIHTLMEQHNDSPPPPPPPEK